MRASPVRARGQDVVAAPVREWQNNPRSRGRWQRGAASAGRYVSLPAQADGDGSFFGLSVGGVDSQ
eukprot:11870026-Alexandrium_andersonii.AAC.1